MQIKDLYAGKPDAKDEINFEGLDEFIKTFVVGKNFNLDSLLKGSSCFITGFKGSGKTALLFYLDNLLKGQDPNTCSSFVFFKEQYTDIKRDELDSLSKRILSSISIDHTTLVGKKEFEYIWRWQLLKRILADNEEYNNGLFIADENWEKFKSLLDLIKSPHDKRKSWIPKRVKMMLPYVDPATAIQISPEIEVDLNDDSDNNYHTFSSVIDAAEILLGQLTRTDIPYYIFIDELEAYYGDSDVFFRDLCLIRDLVFTVKRFNNIFAISKMTSTKIICSVRTEILNAISRFIVTKELNKVTSGFSVPLNWNYNTTSSYMHPIIQILLKRIAVTSPNHTFNYKYLYEKWFPEKIHGIEPANYILNNSWCKPRDIVRLLTVAKQSSQNNNSAFKQSVIDSISKAYAEDSLTEIKEELRALYTSDQIDTIIGCFMGYKTSFSAKQLKERIVSYFPGTILDTNFTQVINDLYRLGFLGNLLPVAKTYRWQHRGDDRVILSDEWRLTVHYALRRALSLGSQQDYGLNRGELPQVGDTAIATITKMTHFYALVEFNHFGQTYTGRIHKNNFLQNSINYNQVNVGEEFAVFISSYSSAKETWNLKLRLPKSILK